MNYTVWNILDLMKYTEEAKVIDLLSGFSCKQIVDGNPVSLNDDIEKFIKSSALQLAKQKTSVSYIISDNDDAALLGYFTIAHKPIEIPASGLSKTTVRIMNRYAIPDEEKNSYTISAFLIAQFGKNYAVDNGTRISGKEMMSIVNKELIDLQHRIGGGIVYLDCEANAKLINFYENEGFRLFGERISRHDGKRYLQYMKIF